MDVVRGFIVVALSVFTAIGVRAESSPPAHYCGTRQWQTLIAEASQKFEIPEAWIEAVLRAESAGCTHMNGKPTISSAGAMGLMQLMPKTWGEYRKRLALGDDPHDPRDNIFAGTAYLRDLYRAYGSPGLFAAYHAGARRYEDYLAGTQPLPQSTLTYLARVQGTHRPTAEVSQGLTPSIDPTERSVFVARRSSAVQPDTHSNTSRAALFVQRSRTPPQAQEATAEPPDVQAK